MGYTARKYGPLWVLVVNQLLVGIAKLLKFIKVFKVGLMRISLPPADQFALNPLAEALVERYCSTEVVQTLSSWKRSNQTVQTYLAVLKKRATTHLHCMALILPDGNSSSMTSSVSWTRCWTGSTGSTGASACQWTLKANWTWQQRWSDDLNHGVSSALIFWRSVVWNNSTFLTSIRLLQLHRLGSDPGIPGPSVDQETDQNANIC